jgi:hypothetical protein
MNYFCSLGRCDRGFDYHLEHDVWCVYVFFCVCAVLCSGTGLATSWSLVQGVLPLWIDQETQTRPGPTRAVEPVKKSLYYETSRYATSSILLLLLLSPVQIFSSAFYSPKYLIMIFFTLNLIFEAFTQNSMKWMVARISRIYSAINIWWT